MYDLHEDKNPYPIFRDGQEYHGGLDGGIAPHGLSISSAANHLRIAYEHKQSNDQKQRYREQHGDMTQGHMSAGALTYRGREKGRSIIASLGAYAYNAWPLLLDLTDGEVHHLIMIRNDELTYWDNLTPQQAYVKQSEILCSSVTLVDRKLKMTSIPEDLQRPLKKLRELQVDSGLLEQLDGIVPDLPCEERLAAAFEIISTWAHLQPIILPPPLQKFLTNNSSLCALDLTLSLFGMITCIVAGCGSACKVLSLPVCWLCSL
ncbi:TPA: hypothetical protein ACH3X1_003903 [Trebouxia sp. C0004]